MEKKILFGVIAIGLIEVIIGTIGFRIVSVIGLNPVVESFNMLRDAGLYVIPLIPLGILTLIFNPVARWIHIILSPVLAFFIAVFLYVTLFMFNPLLNVPFRPENIWLFELMGTVVARIVGIMFLISIVTMTFFFIYYFTCYRVKEQFRWTFKNGSPKTIK